jgi:hypothetical protein
MSAEAPIHFLSKFWELRGGVVIVLLLICTVLAAPVAVANHGNYGVELEGGNQYVLGEPSVRTLKISYDGYDGSNTCLDDVEVVLTTNSGAEIKTVLEDLQDNKVHSFGENEPYSRWFKFKIEEADASEGEYILLVRFTSSVCNGVSNDIEHEQKKAAFLSSSNAGPPANGIPSLGSMPVLVALALGAGIRRASNERN